MKILTLFISLLLFNAVAFADGICTKEHEGVLSVLNKGINAHKTEMAYYDKLKKKIDNFGIEDILDTLGAESDVEQKVNFNICKKFKEIKESNELSEEEKDINIIMSILSNSTPNCIVEAKAECKIDEIGYTDGLESNQFAEKFFHAVEISKIDIGRAATNNKGIMNGIDSVLIATGNDFRAVEASVHSYACKDGQYRGLTECSIDNDIFSIKLKLPLAIGTVGGIIDLHPLVKLSHKILGNPDSSNLMEVVAVAGLAQNFAAIKSLITTGIQKGHMKMHLINLLKKNNASQNQINNAIDFFKEREINNKAVKDFLNSN